SCSPTTPASASSRAHVLPRSSRWQSRNPSLKKRSAGRLIRVLRRPISRRKWPGKFGLKTLCVVLCSGRTEGFWDHWKYSVHAEHGRSIGRILSVESKVTREVHVVTTLSML